MKDRDNKSDKYFYLDYTELKLKIYLTGDFQTQVELIDKMISKYD